MKHILSLVVSASILAAPLTALAQLAPPPPELQNRIPAPLPPPPQPPIINGPLGQGPAPGVYNPPRIDTFGDRVTRCLDQGANSGLSGGKLRSYTRRCANAN